MIFWTVIRIAYWVNLGVCVLVGVPLVFLGGLWWAGGDYFAVFASWPHEMANLNGWVWWITSPIWMLPLYLLAVWMKLRHYRRSRS